MGDPKSVNLNVRAKRLHHYDAIVIGSGISGGWAAKELCEQGLKTLVLERGRNVAHVKDYTTAMMHPWQFEHGLQNPEKIKAEQPIQSAAFDESSRSFFVNDTEHPYIQKEPFHWIRGYQVGGRSLTWGRQTYRLSDLDFEANLKDGIAVDWPIRYRDIDPWYDYVEKFIGVSGQAEGLPHLPDGCFLPPMEMNCVEKHFKEKIEQQYAGRKVTIGRCAHLTKGWNGRGPCQNRNLCKRGCPFGGYFSSNAATLPAAAATGNLTIRPFSIVTEIMYNAAKGKADGVRIIDAETNTTYEYYADVIFLNASTIASAFILLHSASRHFPEGLGNGSGQVGLNLMDHHTRVGASGVFNGYKDQYYSGRRPNGIFVPRFRNISPETTTHNYIRGFNYQADAEREGWMEKAKRLTGFGTDFKQELTTPGDWTMWMGAWGETLPDQRNKVTISHNKKDKWNLPLVEIDFKFRNNEKQMRKDMQQSAVDMLHAAGFTNVKGFDYDTVGGDCVHEMGTARMGNDPRTSVLNKWNQMHEVPNVFVTDGSCMTSAACQNPSLTYMALTARACHYAVGQLKKGNL